MKLTVSVFKALSDRNRLRIIGALMEYDELCACQITELLQVRGATASRHLGILVSAELIDSRKVGRWVYYRLRKAKDRLRPMLRWMKTEFAVSNDIKNDRQKLRKILACKPEDICRRQRGDDCC